jgi:hypothetical protein
MPRGRRETTSQATNHCLGPRKGSVHDTRCGHRPQRAIRPKRWQIPWLRPLLKTLCAPRYGIEVPAWNGIKRQG